MFSNKHFCGCLAGLCAGLVNGLFGAGGGMLLVPLVSMLSDTADEEVFSNSVAIILPICIVSLCFSLTGSSYSFIGVLPYLFGSFMGGLLAWKLGEKIPVKWLHRLLGLFILWGGIRYLC